MVHGVSDLRMSRQTFRMLNQCLRKRKHRTEAKAKEVAEKMAEHHGRPFHAYWCDVCQHWHVGSGESHASA